MERWESLLVGCACLFAFNSELFYSFEVVGRILSNSSKRRISYVLLKCYGYLLRKLCIVFYSRFNCNCSYAKFLNIHY